MITKSQYWHEVGRAARSIADTHEDAARASSGDRDEQQQVIDRIDSAVDEALFSGFDGRFAKHFGFTDESDYVDAGLILSYPHFKGHKRVSGTVSRVLEAATREAILGDIRGAVFMDIRGRLD